jgi:hypothetical protein
VAQGVGLDFKPQYQKKKVTGYFETVVTNAVKELLKSAMEGMIIHGQLEQETLLVQACIAPAGKKGSC